MNKYIKRTGTKITNLMPGITLYQIECAKPFIHPVTHESYKKGEVGGWVCDETELKGLSWVGHDSVVVRSKLTDSIVTIKSKCVDSTLDHTSIRDNVTVEKCDISWYKCVSAGHHKSSRLIGNPAQNCFVHDSYLTDSVITSTVIINSTIINSFCTRSKIIDTHQERADISDSYLDFGKYLRCKLSHCTLTVNSKSTITNVELSNTTVTIQASVIDITNSNQLLTIGPSLTSGRFTTGVWNKQTNKVIVRCGCFEGTIKQFVIQIYETHEHSPADLAVYKMFADTLTSWSKLHKNGTIT